MKGESEPQEESETRMSLKDVDDFLINRLKSESEPLKESAKKEYANLQMVAGTMCDRLASLRDAPYSERTYPILIRKAVGSRKSFIHKMESLIEQVQKPIGEDMDSILSFHNDTAKLLNLTNAKTVKEYAFLKELFEKEAERVIESFQQMVEIDKRLGNTIKKFKDSNVKLLNVQKVAAEVSKLIEESKSGKGAGVSDESLREIENKKTKAENELERLLNSKEWENFLGMQRHVEDTKMKMQGKKSDFIRSLAKVEKPLKKYKWGIENKVLDDYAQRSFESVLAEDPRGEMFMSAIKDMRTKIIEEKMDLKDSRKFLAIIEKMIEDNTIGDILEGYSKLSEGLRRQEESIMSHEAPKRRNGLEVDISKLKKEAEGMMAERELAEERRKGVLADTEQKVNELEGLLTDVVGKRVSLEVNRSF